MKNALVACRCLSTRYPVPRVPGPGSPLKQLRTLNSSNLNGVYSSPLPLLCSCFCRSILSRCSRASLLAR